MRRYLPLGGRMADIIAPSWIFNDIRGEAFESLGWYEVTTHRVPDRAIDLIDIIEWCDENTTKPWKRVSSKFFFQSHKDAMLFALRWL